MKIEDLDLTVRAHRILRYLKINTLEELRTATLPEIGTTVYYVPISMTRVTYSSKVDNEIKELLNS